MKKLILPFLILITSLAYSQGKPAYTLFTKGGKEVKYNKMLKVLVGADVILFGELHNNPICHWMELEVTKDVFVAKKEKLVLGAEMFETDDQLTLDEYLKGQILAKHFTTEAKVWPNNKTDYQPLVDFAKDNKLQFAACNIPRKYANYVARKGIESLNDLTDEQKQYIAPLPIEIDMSLPGYKMFVDMGMGHGSEMSPEKMAQAQATKDATMAHRILKYWKDGMIFIHYNGAYHSNNFEGISWYLKKKKADLKIITISTVEQDDISSLEEESKNLADYILVIPASMTKTY